MYVASTCMCVCVCTRVRMYACMHVRMGVHVDYLYF